ncbi:MAG: sigma-70 family RNA polymerase sigma factor [Planctomycetota bacterium]|nr:sigma-70 family RNA polymerase sigma factor [Planctomycetota bacterium]
MTDRELFDRIRAGEDEEAFADLVRRHHAMVHAVCLRVLGNPTEAEDAAQAAYLVLVRKARSLPAGTVLAGWLHRTAELCAREARRGRARRLRHEREATGMHETSDAEAEAAWSGLRPNLDAALAELPESQRASLVLQYLAGRSQAEAALELGCPVETHRTRVRRGLETLRQRLQGRGVRVSGALLVFLLAERAHGADAPARLAASIRAACRTPAGASPEAARIAEEVARMLSVQPLKVTAALCAAVLFLLAGVAGLLGAAETGSPPAETRRPAPQTAAPPAAPAHAPATRRPGWAIRGILHDPSGRPLAGARLFADNGSPRQQMMEGRAEPQPWRRLEHYEPQTPAFWYGHDPVLSDEQGRFEILGIAPPVGGGMIAYHPAYKPLRVSVKRNMADEAGDVDLGTLTFAEGLALAGKVVDAGGQPLPGAWVGVQAAIRDDQGLRAWTRIEPGDIRVTRSNAKGEFELRGLAARPYFIAAWNDRCPPVEQAADLERDSAPAEQAFVLRESKPLRVTVLRRGDRAPWPGCMVMLSDEQGEVTGPDGVSTFHGVPEGPLGIDISPPHRVPDREKGEVERIPFGVFGLHRKAQAGDEVVVELEPPLDLKLSVVDAATGAPLSGVRVNLCADYQAWDRARGNPGDLNFPLPDPEAVHTLSGPRPGPWTLWVFAEGYEQPAPRRIMLPDGGLDEPLKVALTRATGALRGRVVDETGGQPLAGVKVQLTQTLKRFGAASLEVKTADDGSWKFEGLQPGAEALNLGFHRDGYLRETLRLQAKRERQDPFDDLNWGYHNHRARIVEYEKGAPRPEEAPLVRMVRPATLKGLIHDPQGKPMRKYGVSVYAAGEARNLKMSIFARLSTGEDGRFECALPPGRYDVVYGHRDWQAETNADLKAGETLELKLRSEGPMVEDEF